MSCFEDIARKSNFAVIVVTLQNYYVDRKRGRQSPDKFP